MKEFFLIVNLGILLVSSIALSIRTEQIVLAIVGSLGGSLVLSYFRREEKFETVFKVLVSTIGGVFVGTAIIKYFELESLEYLGVVYFLTSFQLLIFLKAYLVFTESNALNLIKAFFQRLGKVEVKESKKE